MKRFLSICLSIILLLSIVSLALAESIFPLHQGSKGKEVEELQTYLLVLKYFTGNADGSFGEETMSAVEKYQADYKFDVTGIVDENLLQHIKNRAIKELDPSLSTEDAELSTFSEQEQKLITAAKCLQKSMYFPETMRLRSAALQNNSENNDIVVFFDCLALTLGNTYKDMTVYIRVSGQMYDIQHEPETKPALEENDKEILNNAEYSFTFFYINLYGFDGWTLFDDLTQINTYLQNDISVISYNEMPDKY